MKYVVDIRKMQEARLNKGFTQSDLAKAVGMTTAGISFIETGRVKTPSPRTLKRISDALDLNVSDICRMAK